MQKILVSFNRVQIIFYNQRSNSFITVYQSLNETSNEYTVFDFWVISNVILQCNIILKVLGSNQEKKVRKKTTASFQHMLSIITETKESIFASTVVPKFC